MRRWKTSPANRRRAAFIRRCARATRSSTARAAGCRTHAPGGDRRDVPERPPRLFFDLPSASAQNIAQERHTLRLVIADNVSRKVALARLDFRVVGVTDAKKG